MGYDWRVWWIPDNPKVWSSRYDVDRPKRKCPFSPSDDPEVTAKQAEWNAKARPNRGKPRGATTGFNRKQREATKKKAKEEAVLIVKYLEEKGMTVPKNEFAKEALETAVALMRRDDLHPKDKLSAAKAVLEWTMAKPASESNVNVRTAESFLEEIAQEMGLENKQ